MGKNIVICCDGTDNKLTLEKNTNIVYLYSCLIKNENQITYYNPGVGTIAPDSMGTNFRRFFYKIRDYATAISLTDKVKDAYIFLMENYEEGDQVYLFGFSRGAYTVRMLCGLIEMFGLIHKGNTNHLRYILEIYSNVDNKFALANSFRNKFSRKIEIKFIGVWDTVVSVGNIFKNKKFPYSKKLEIAKTVRHAVAIDERRKLFYFYEVNPQHQDLIECFFAGVHSDVGGSYLESESGLSKIALEWMLGEASNNGLILNKKNVDKYLFGQDTFYQKPDFKQNIHDSLKGYKFLSVFPRKIYTKKGNEFKKSYDFRLFPPRDIPKNAYIHESVFEKVKLKEAGHHYNPLNINLGSDSSYISISNKGILY